MGADILLLNLFDCVDPQINALTKCEPMERVRMLKKLTGRPIGINLEPVEQELETGESMWAMTSGRKATLENARRAADMGVNFILLTGNPGMGVTNEAIVQTLQLYKRELGDRLVLAAGKMHAAGILTEGAEKIITKEDVKAFAEAGADIILMPAPGTVPGITLELVRELVSYAHSLGCLTITAIGTSQEGADVATIRQIALMAKMTGTDIHHLGDAGYGGMSLPENIQAYSVAIRGIRHTYRRMAASVNR
jgi:putative N-acetylmannosamine-6-phosphate epimerase